MTLQEFQEDYYCKCILRQDNTGIIIESQIIKRSNNAIIRSETSTISNQTIRDHNEVIGKLIDQYKRAHLDIFARCMPIDNYYPNNLSVDISSMYA